MAFIKGTKFKETLQGTSLADLILGLAGDDTLFGKAGIDTLRGGDGNDKLFGGSGDDKLFGDKGDDRLDGGAGKDALHGGAGHDVLKGGLGDDILNGNAGDDTLNGGDGKDALNGGFGDDRAFGDAGDDTVNGNEGNDLVSGGTGADKLYGGTGDDILRPGADLDADAIDGGDGIDTVDYSNAIAGLHVNLSTGLATGAAQNDTFTSIENIIGSDFSDILQPSIDGGTAFGGKGDDSLQGGAGAIGRTYILRGGEGSDILSAGANSQDLLQLEYNKGADTIRAVFRNSDADRLLIDRHEFDIGLGLNPNEIRNIGAVDPIASNIASAQFIFRATAHELYFDKDGTGAVFAPILIATVQFSEGDANVITPSDFYII